MDCLVCTIGSIQIAIPRAAVLEVMDAGALHAAPGALPWAAGFAYVRGTALLFVALGRADEYAAAAAGRRKAVRVPAGEMAAAVLVDATGQFVDVEPAAPTTSSAASSAARMPLGAEYRFLQRARFAKLDAAEPSPELWMFEQRVLAEALR